MEKGKQACFGLRDLPVGDREGTPHRVVVSYLILDGCQRGLAVAATKAAGTTKELLGELAGALVTEGFERRRSEDARLASDVETATEPVERVALPRVKRLATSAQNE
ncbi:MAG: hypothetical protein ACRD2X_13370 [Vicinamibacteraceae bacterium]